MPTETPSCFNIYWINLGYRCPIDFETLDAAVAHGKAAGFEFNVSARVGNISKIFAGYTIFGGLTEYQNS